MCNITITQNKNIEGGKVFNGEIGQKEFKASYSKTPYFIHIERTDSIKKPLSEKERKDICNYLKENFELEK